MIERPLGDWRWYFGSAEDDDEMCDCGDRASAIRDGLREYKVGESFWIVEARMAIDDEEAMGAGERDTAPFAESRFGQWIKVGPDRRAIEGGA